MLVSRCLFRLWSPCRAAGQNERWRAREFRLGEMQAAFWKQRMDRIFEAIDDHNAEAQIVFLCEINTVKQNELTYPEKYAVCKAPEDI